MDSVLQVLGGLGLFLLGMSLMTEGLKSLAGSSLRKALARFTQSPTSGAITGALVTAVVQSSSITVVTAVGFVGARLLSFSEALGVVFGANLGTTITGWFVALIGFKLSLDQAMLPLVFAGALLHLFGRGRLRKVGFAVAGFGLIFVGISMLQGGMAAAEHLVSPQTFPSDTVVGRFQLVLIGGAVTLVTQSSSAGVATAIAAVSAGAISFPQAAALVIGMDVGTTVTAALATLGGDTSVRRTGLSHVVYNLLTGAMAFGLLTPYARIVETVAPGALQLDPELSLVGFHTFFNAVGVVIVLPFAKNFASFIERVFPENAGSLVRHLTAGIQDDEFMALCAVHRTLLEVSLRVFGALEPLLCRADQEPIRSSLPDLTSALRSVDSFLVKLQTNRELGLVNDAHLAVLHALDHLKMLIALCEQTGVGPQQAELRELCELAARDIADMSETMEREENGAAAPSSESHKMAAAIEKTRHELLESAASGRMPIDVISQALTCIYWLSQIESHARRIHHHLRAFPLSRKRRAARSRLSRRKAVTRSRK